MKLLPNKQFVAGIGKKLLDTADQNRPAVMMGFGIAAGAAALWAMHEAAKKEDSILDERLARLNELEKEQAEKKEPTPEDIQEYKDARKEVNLHAGLKLAKIYVPVAVAGTLSFVCLLVSHRVSMRRQAAAEAAYRLAMTKMHDYIEKTREIVGPKKAVTIHDEVMKDKVSKKPPRDNQIILTGGGDVVCYDEHTGRYFRSNPETIRKAVNDLNLRLRDEMFLSLNEFYYEIGLGRVAMGDDLGWNIDRGAFEIEYTTMLLEDVPGVDTSMCGLPGKTPILVLSYDVQPRYNFFGEEATRS